MSTIDWEGASGETYKYWFVENVNNMQAVGGNYTFVKQLPNGNWAPVYFGIADDLQARLPNHERWAEAVRAGATRVMAHTTPAGAEVRAAEERDLIRFWNPALNIQHRTAG